MCLSVKRRWFKWSYLLIFHISHFCIDLDITRLVNQTRITSLRLLCLVILPHGHWRQCLLGFTGFRPPQNEFNLVIKRLKCHRKKPQNPKPQIFFWLCHWPLPYTYL